MPRYVVGENGWVYPDGHPRDYKIQIALTTAGNSYFLGCCGMAGLQNFGYCHGFRDWNDKAEMLACLYKHLYQKGTVVYAITQDQLKKPMHQLLLEIGSQQVAEFPNLYHGPNMIHLFKVNIRNAAGRFCNRVGQAYAEPPKDDSEIIPEQTGPGEAGVYAEFPRN